VKGAIDYLGSDKIDVLLVNDQGNSEKEADKLIDIYAMKAYPRVRMSNEACGMKLLSDFGHFSWGYIVIGADGKLVANNILAHQLKPALEKAVSAGAQDKGKFSVNATWMAGMPVGGIKKLKKARETNVTLMVNVPAGWHIYGHGDKNPTPTEIKIAFAPGVEVGTPVFPNGTPGSGGATQHKGPIKIVVPVTFPVGMAIGHHVVHGTVSFMACNADTCLPPMTLEWFADCTIM